MSAEARKLYVGCGLTHAPETFRNSVDGFKKVLRSNGHEVFDFVGLVAGTEADVYNWDIGHCVARADLLIGVCDEPSIGLGWELAVAAEKLEIPVLATAHTDSKVTRLIHGAAEVLPNVQFASYDNLEHDIPPLVDEILLAAYGLKAVIK